VCGEHHRWYGLAGQQRLQVGGRKPVLLGHEPIISPVFWEAPFRPCQLCWQVKQFGKLDRRA
jgi:hypothetical protein